MARAPRGPKQIETLLHDEATRTNIPTAELQSTAERLEEMQPAEPAAYPRAQRLSPGEWRMRDKDADPQIIWNGARIRLTPAQIKQIAEDGEVEIGEAQLVWRGKDEQDWSDLVVPTPPVYIQEKIHPKAIIDDLKRRSASVASQDEADLFASFSRLGPDDIADFYKHDDNWSNRMILGDSLQVMASLAERERLAGKVQCIYFDPPYGIKFNSNWQVSTQSRDVRDGKQTDLSREPEQVKAFRDTWKDQIHSYLTYLRDRLTVMRELLTDRGSIFVQIGDENVHRVRAVMDEVFGSSNYVLGIVAQKTGSQTGAFIQSANDYVLWYARDIELAVSKFRALFLDRTEDETDDDLPSANPLTSDGFRPATTVNFEFQGRVFHPGTTSHWKVLPEGLARVGRAGRIIPQNRQIRFAYYHKDFPVTRLGPVWSDLGGASDKIYVVQTTRKLIERCVLMTTDPGDLVLDPTCGSGTTAFVAEQWGRRWITVDTSRVALALARTRLMSARYSFYLLADSPEGRRKEQEVSGKPQPLSPTLGDIRQGFVYERAPHVTLKSIADNAEIDIIWESWQAQLERLREELSRLTGEAWEEWQVPRETSPGWSDATRAAHAAWWDARAGRQKEIDASIARRADVELLYDRPHTDSNRIRVSGPFTVESLSPHRVVLAPTRTCSMLRTPPARANAAAAPRRHRSRISPPWCWRIFAPPVFSRPLRPRRSSSPL